MKTIDSVAHARAGLLGNPSDGFYGKTLSVEVRNFTARVTLTESDAFEILPGREEACVFTSLDEFVENLRQVGLYGGMRLVKATIKRFTDYCREKDIELARKNFTLRYESDIPRQVGLAGSSAIITAVFRALLEFYGVDIPRTVLPGLVLSVETRGVGIQAGLQDRVAQVYGGLVYMDFERAFLEKNGHGRYETLDPSLLPPLYLAYRSEFAEDSDVYHSDLRARWEAGDPEVVKAMKEFGEITALGRNRLLESDNAGFSALMDRNFDTRQRISTLNPQHERMIEVARTLGVSAKFAGSGGTVVGVCEDEAVYQRLSEKFSEIGCTVVRPKVA